MTPLVSSDDIVKEFRRAANLSQPDLNQFIQKGVPQSALTHPDLLLRADVVFDLRGKFFDFAEPSDDAERSAAFIFLAKDEFGDADDLIAWRPGDALLTCWLRRAAVLGAEGIFSPRLSTPPAPPVWRSPLNWLRADRRGVVVVDWHFAPSVLNAVGPLLAEDVEHASQLRRRLARRAPRVITPPLGSAE